MDNIIPLPMEARGLDVNARHLLLGYFAPRSVTAPIQTASNTQSLGGGRAGDQPDYRLVISQRFATPVGRDEREQPVLDFVPLAGARGKMAHRDRQSRLVRQTLQLQLPKPQPIPIAATAVGGAPGEAAPAVGGGGAA